MPPVVAGAVFEAWEIDVEEAVLLVWVAVELFEVGRSVVEVAKVVREIEELVLTPADTLDEVVEPETHD